MRVGEPDAFARNPIHVGRGDFSLRVVGLHVAIAQVVAEDDDDVGFVSGDGAGGKEREEDGVKFHGENGEGHAGGSGAGGWAFVTVPRASVKPRTIRMTQSTA